MRFRLVPVLILVAFLALAVRMGEFSMGANSGGFASAQTEVNERVPPFPSIAGENADPLLQDEAPQTAAETPDTIQSGQDPAAPEAVNTGNTATDSAADASRWTDATEFDYEYSTVRQDLYDDLHERRAALDQRERALATREALLKAAERELDQKMRELTAVRDEISELLQQQSAEEEARMVSLVKIYEGMKAKDAANIFNTLDIDVLIAVMGRMSERKSAPILAEMNPERARTVTILLAQQKQLPSIPPQ